MSWSGPPSGGGPPYQPSPYAQQSYPQQPPYHQQQYGQTPYQQPYQAPPNAPPQGQPPHTSSTYAPKRKGNPVITRYPPPPNYRPPQPPSGAPAYGQNQYPPPGYPQPPPHSYPSQQGYQAPPYQQGYQGYQQPPSYPPQGYQGWQPPPGYQPPAQGFPPAQGYPQGYQAPGPPDPASATSSYPTNGWQQSPTYSQPPDPSATPTSVTVQPVTGNSSPIQAPRPPKSRRGTSSRTASIINPAEIPESHKLYQSEAYTIDLGLDDWDHTDFDGAIWPKANDPIDPNFSLGVIIWHPANQVTRALPSDFREAEDSALKLPLPTIGNGESVSEYFGPENAHEAFLNVRQTEEWEVAKQDSIFYEFPETYETADAVPLEGVIANRDRPDLPEDEERPPVEEHVDDNENRDSDWNVMDNLEQALSSEQAAGGSKTPPASGPSLPQVPRDDAQEALLASLGVTGSPKPINPATAPVYMPPNLHQGTKRDRTGDGERPYEPIHAIPPPPPHYHNGYGPPQPGGPSHGLPPHFGQSHSPPIPPPPPQPNRSPSYDPWKADQIPSRNGFDSRRSPARSDTSQHTAAGSDFHMDDNDPFNANATDTPRPPLNRSESGAGRKRSYDETEPGDGKQRQEDDYTPRIKRRQPRVAAAYGPSLPPEPTCSKKRVSFSEPLVTRILEIEPSEDAKKGAGKILVKSDSSNDGNVRRRQGDDARSKSKYKQPAPFIPSVYGRR